MRAPPPVSTPPGATNAAPIAYVFGEFTLDVASRQLRRDTDSDVQLPSRAFDALLYLVEHRDRLVQKNELVEAVWHDVVVTDDSLIHAISVLRRALADDPNEPRYVQTVPRRGYRFVAAVRVIPGRTAPTETAHRPSAASASFEAAGAAIRADTAPRRIRWLPQRNAASVGIAIALAAAIGVACASLWGGFHRNAEVREPGRAVRLFQPAPEGATIVSSGVLSPDGRCLTFVARDNLSGRSTLWVRTLHSSELKPLDNTAGASKPFWSPDSARIGFFASGNLMTVNAAGGEARTVARVGITPAGGTWAGDDTILFADWAKGLYAVGAHGGEPETVATLDRTARDIAFSWPQFLPDGRHFLYQIVSLDAARTGTYVGDLDTRKSVRLLDTESPAVFAPPQYVLHIQRDMLIAEEFDVRTLQLTGRATVLARGVSTPSPADENVVSAAGDLIAYRQGIRQQQLAWVNRSGEILSTVHMPIEVFNPRVSPDGSQLLATSSVTTNPGLWLASLSRTEFERLETDAIAPLWSPDGGRIAYTARGGFDLIVRSTASGDSRPLVTDGAIKILNDWSPDGEQIVYTQLDDRTRMDLWGIRVKDGTVFPILATPFNEMQARISPDGKWIAYVSDESGAAEVYAQHYPQLGERYKVSADGGGQPQWRHDQREMFYIAPDHTIVAVPVDPSGGQPTFGSPQRLFRAPGPEGARDNYAATADGRRFLVDGSIADVGNTAITVVVNWPAEAGVAAQPRAQRLE
ncbi:MAG: winged helix-turn-helix domain-containing protein [Gammaproteobacteria bacterium]